MGGSYGTTVGEGRTQAANGKRGIAWGFAGLAGCAVLCLAAVVATGGQQGWGMEEGGRGVELLCSDGRCGEGSKLSMKGAVKDLEKWSDKAELKDRLDELQTTMERGMSHKAEVNQLNQYFNGLDMQVKKQRMHALRQEQSEGQSTAATLASAKHSTPQLAHMHRGRHSVRHSKATSGDDSSNSGSEESNADGEGGDVKDSAEGGADENEVSKYQGPDAMSAREAQADLNSYFDSLEKKTGRHGKMHNLETEVRELKHEVHSLKSPVNSARDAADRTSAAVHSLGSKLRSHHGLEKEVHSLKADDEKIIALEKSKHEAADVEGGAAAVPPGNPQVHAAGLPKGWKEYRDLKTHYPYWYNARTGKSTWVKPTGESPREQGVKLLALLHEADSAKQTSLHQMESADKKAALADDHGVYGHHWARSQWTDSKWMNFLDGSNVKGMGSMETNAQRLDGGREAADHAMLRPASSSRY